MPRGSGVWYQGREVANTIKPVTTADSWGGTPGRHKIQGNDMKFTPPPIWGGRVWIKSSPEGRFLGLLIVWHLGPDTCSQIQNLAFGHREAGNFLGSQLSSAKGPPGLCTHGVVRPRFRRPAWTPCYGQRLFPYGVAWSAFQRSLSSLKKCLSEDWVSVPWLIQAAWI